MVLVAIMQPPVKQPTSFEVYLTQAKPDPIEEKLEPLEAEKIPLPEPVVVEALAKVVTVKPIVTPKPMSPAPLPAVVFSTASANVIRRQPVGSLADKLDDQIQLYYPDVYVQKRIEGDVLLRLYLDQLSGRVMAARVESESPYPLFNEAARHAALASIPAVDNAGATEILLPVKFRLRR